MDGRQFDAWVKRVSDEAFRWESRPQTGRRGLLTGAAGGVLVVASGVLTGEEILAKRKKKKKKGKKKTDEGQGICGKQCGTVCEANIAVLFCNFSNPGCTCLRSTSGEIHCADTSAVSCPSSPAVDQCQSDTDCGQNAICIRTAGGHCCTEPGEAQVNLCVPKCLNLTTASVESLGTSESLLTGVLRRLRGR